MDKKCTETQNNDVSIECYTTKVYCNGGNNVLGHPGVYLRINMNLQAICPYCNKTYIYIGRDIYADKA